MPIAMLSTSLLTNPQRYGRFNALDTENPFGPKPGMVLMKPTSIDNSSGSASVNDNGQVTFSAVTSLSLNGVFTADFDNYVLAFNAKASANEYIRFRMRSSGTDDSGSNYTHQYLLAGSTTIAGARSTGASNGTIGIFGGNASPSANTFYIYGPALAQPTASRGVSMSTVSTIRIDDYVSTHSLSTSYDGITFFPDANNITGSVAVYGVRS
jgi:hypothetical protein